MMDDPRERVYCWSTGHGAGCGHPVDWHTGPTTPAPDCECCSWRKSARRPEPVRMPAPEGVPVVKWTSMSRRERRAAARNGGKR